jgi:hypothetical protein
MSARLMPIDSIRSMPRPYQPSFDPANICSEVESRLTTLGSRSVILIDQDNTIIAGEGTYAVLRQNGHESIWVYPMPPGRAGLTRAIHCQGSHFIPRYDFPIRADLLRQIWPDPEIDLTSEGLSPEMVSTAWFAIHYPRWFVWMGDRDTYFPKKFPLD